MTTIAQIKEIVGPNTIRNVEEKRLYDYGYSILEMRLEQLINDFYSMKSQMLNVCDILPHVRTLLIDPVFMKYTLEHIDIQTQFHQVYREVFMKDRVYFENIHDPYMQFALAWLFTRYH